MLPLKYYIYTKIAHLNNPGLSLAIKLHSTDPKLLHSSPSVSHDNHRSFEWDLQNITKLEAINSSSDMVTNVHQGFASVDIGFLGMTFYHVTLSCFQYLYNAWSEHDY